MLTQQSLGAQLAHILRHPRKSQKPYEEGELSLIRDVLEEAGFPGVMVSQEDLTFSELVDRETGRREDVCYNGDSGIAVYAPGLSTDDRRNAIHSKHWGTGWFNCLTACALRVKPVYEREVFIEQEIERSRPLQPIIINQHGECIIEPEPSLHQGGTFGASGRFLFDHTRDDHQLYVEKDIKPVAGAMWSPIGRHGPLCLGQVSVRFLTDDLMLLSCEHGCFAHRIPRSITTYGALRKHFPGN